MARLNIAMINGIRPQAGSGDGITEYAYNLCLQLSRQNKVDLVYSIERARKNDVLGLIRINSTLSHRSKLAAGEDYDIFHIMNQEVGFAAMDVKSVNRKNAVVTTVHDTSRFEKGLQKGRLQAAYNTIVRRSFRKAVESSDFLIFNSTQTMGEVRKRFGFRNGAVISMGIDKRFSAKKSEPRHTGFNVGYMGSFAYHKNAIMLVKAANILKNSRINFQMYGVGVEARDLEEYAADNSLHNLELMGFAPEDMKVGIYDGFDAFAFPSMYEGFGFPILEAQARGLPVIIYKYGRIPKEVRRYCFEAEDEAHMAGIIEELRDNGYSSRLRKKAAEYARSFTWERCAKETLKVYNRIVNV